MDEGKTARGQWVVSMYSRVFTGSNQTGGMQYEGVCGVDYSGVGSALIW